MMRNPLVSIIIPVYNGSNYLAEAINSALAQTYNNIEIIVINDGSNDSGETESIALSYGDKIKYFSKVNGGVSSALNIGINNMSGEWFSWLSHDDLYAQDKIQKQVNAITSENDIILCSGYLIDENRNRMKYYTKTLDKKINGQELFLEFLHGYGFNGLGFLIPKNVFAHVGNFDETMRYLQDYDLWLRIMHYGYNFVCQDELLVMNRVHKNQTTNTASDLYNVDRKKLAQKHIDILNNENITNKSEWLVLYLCLFVRDRNIDGIKRVKEQLKSENSYTIKVRLMTLHFVLRGIISRFFKKIFNTILLLKKQRG